MFQLPAATLTRRPSSSGVAIGPRSPGGRRGRNGQRASELKADAEARGDGLRLSPEEAGQLERRKPFERKRSVEAAEMWMLEAPDAPRPSSSVRTHHRGRDRLRRSWGC
jgi:hypothetical protein